MEVYNEIGPGSLQEVYPKKMKKRYKPNLYAPDCIIVELKAQKTLASENEAQLLNYLKGARKKVGKSG